MSFDKFKDVLSATFGLRKDLAIGIDVLKDPKLASMEILMRAGVGDFDALDHKKAVLVSAVGTFVGRKGIASGLAYLKSKVDDRSMSYGELNSIDGQEELRALCRQ
jgi:hypothetical protein